MGFLSSFGNPRGRPRAWAGPLGQPKISSSQRLLIIWQPKVVAISNMPKKCESVDKLR